MLLLREILRFLLLRPPVVLLLLLLHPKLPREIRLDILRLLRALVPLLRVRPKLAHPEPAEQVRPVPRALDLRLCPRHRRHDVLPRSLIRRAVRSLQDVTPARARRQLGPIPAQGLDDVLLVPRPVRVGAQERLEGAGPAGIARRAHRLARSHRSHRLDKLGNRVRWELEDRLQHRGAQHVAPPAAGAAVLVHPQQRGRELRSTLLPRRHLRG